MDDSTLSEKLVDSLRMVSAAVLSLITGIVAISVYLLQRSIRYFANPPNIPSMFSSSSNEGFQILFWGLQFGYETLTLVWPAVLGGLCFGASALLRKRREILNHLQRLNPKLPAEVLETLDPFFAGSVVAAIRARPALWLMTFLPMIALMPHFLSAAIAFVSILTPQTAYSRWLSWTLPVFVFVVVVLIFTSVFGFFGARDFARAMRTTLIVKPLKRGNGVSP